MTCVLGVFWRPGLSFGVVSPVVFFLSVVFFCSCGGGSCFICVLGVFRFWDHLLVLCILFFVVFGGFFSCCVSCVFDLLGGC